MDAVALVGCGVLGRLVRRHYFSKSSSTTHHSVVLLDISISLSLCLLSLGVFEFLPLQCLLWIRRVISMEMAYHWMFLAMVTHCAVIIPVRCFYVLLDRCFARTPCSFPWGMKSVQQLPTTTATLLSSTSAARPWMILLARLVSSLLLAILCSILICLPWLQTLISQPQSTSLFDSLLYSLLAIGVLIAAILNGFGSVVLPWTFLIGWWLAPVHPHSIVLAEQALEQTRSTLRRQQQQQETTPNNLVPRTFMEISTVMQHRNEKQRKTLAFLETLLQEQQDDLVEMRAAFHMTQSAQTTLLGRVCFYLGMIFSLVLVYRLMLALWRMVFFIVPTSSASAKVPPMILSLLFDDEHLELATQYTSLLIVLVLRVTQTRNFLRRSSFTNATAAFGPVIALTLCCYTMALQYPQQEVRVRHVDRVYGLSALITAGVFTLRMLIQRANTVRYNKELLFPLVEV